MTSDSVTILVVLRQGQRYRNTLLYRLVPPAAIRPSNIPSLKSPIALQKPRIGAKIYSEDVFDIHPISAIPGYTDDQLPGQMYSGYISVGHGKHLYFIFYVHPSPYKQPVVVWMNGGEAQIMPHTSRSRLAWALLPHRLCLSPSLAGPGCSSMDGFVYEHGPFIFAPGEPTVDTPDPLPVLSRNPFGWHEHASVMWVDSPAGVSVVTSDSARSCRSIDGHKN